MVRCKRLSVTCHSCSGSPAAEAAALLANAREWLVDCGDGVRLQGFLSLTRGNGVAKEVTVDPAERRIAADIARLGRQR